MKFKLVNSKYDDYVIIESETIEEAREKAKIAVEKRGWNEKDMYSEEV